MHILLSNDDGIFAEGLYALAQELSAHYTVTVVAPEMQQSGKSHSTTFAEPVRIRKVVLRDLPDVSAYAASGTPADCVRLGCTSLGIDPDIVVSGINHGANLGTHVLYSGTVGAAMEAALSGKPAIATSCCHWHPTDFSAAARASLRAVQYASKHPIPRHMILNLNTPHIPISDLKGIKLAPLHMQEYDSHHVQFEDPRGNHYFWMAFQERTPLDESLDTDLKWMEHGYATLTPIHCDITNYAYMQTMDISEFDIHA